MGAELEHQFVVFTLHGEQYALPVTSVREIVRYMPPTATAAARGLVRGLINLRGRVLPVADISPRLGQALEIEIGTGTRILVVEVVNGTLGMLVDRVDGVVDLLPEQIEAVPVAVDTDGLGDKVAVVRDRLVMVLDPERALGDVLPKPPAARRARKPKPAPAAGTTARKPRARKSTG